MKTELAIFIVSYFTGSIPFGLIVSKLKAGIDIRQVGSGSTRATNVLRTLSKRWAAFVFLCDLGKGFVVVLATLHLTDSVLWTALMPVPVILGHNYPVFARFKGGKGVATALGAYLAMMPVPAAIAFGTWIAVVALWRYVSVGSMIGCFSASLYGYLFGYPNEIVIVCFAGGFFIMYRHKENIRRLLSGVEPKIGQKVDLAPTPSEP